jgi:hypothetical protein
MGMSRLAFERLRVLLDAPSEEHARLITPWAKKARFAQRAELRKKGFPILISGLKRNLNSVNILIERIQSITEPIIISKKETNSPPYIHAHKKRAVNIIRGYSANQILHHGSIPVPAKLNLEPIAGCHPQSLVLHKALKLLGFKPRMVQEIVPGHTHTAIMFEHEGKTYCADVFYQTLQEATAEQLLKYKTIPTRPMSYTKYRRTIAQSKKN